MRYMKRKKMKRVLLLLLLVCASMKMAAQDFVNLTAEEVRIDSVLPVCYHEFPLGTVRFQYLGNLQQASCLGHWN